MLFSVVMPVYNGEKFLGECLDAVEAQGFGVVVLEEAPVLSASLYNVRRYGKVRVADLRSRMNSYCSWGVRKRRCQGRTCR